MSPHTNQATATLDAKQCQAEASREASPVEMAMSHLSNEIADVHFRIDHLMSRLEPAMCSPSPEAATNTARPCMPSPLAESIEQMADSVRAARSRLVETIERLTL